MTSARVQYWIAAVIFVFAASVVCTAVRAEAQIHWPDPPKKAPMRVRLVAVALADPRSSFFSSHEILIAEKEIAPEEWGLIKLVYSFLPYQPRLSETGFDYSVVHEFSATRDSSCDETLAQLQTRESNDHGQIDLKYSPNAPKRDLDRRRIPLPCYETTADDYAKSAVEPIPPPEVHPTLQTRKPEPQGP